MHYEKTHDGGEKAQLGRSAGWEYQGRREEARDHVRDKRDDTQLGRLVLDAIPSGVNQHVHFDSRLWCRSGKGACGRVKENIFPIPSQVF